MQKVWILLRDTVYAYLEDDAPRLDYCGADSAKFGVSPQIQLGIYVNWYF